MTEAQELKLRKEAAEFWLEEMIKCRRMDDEGIVIHTQRMMEVAKKLAAEKPAWVTGLFYWDPEARLPYVLEIGQQIVDRLSPAGK